MFSSPRLILVLFLAMLQLVAPLAHAHARVNLATSGLHIPGLEIYSADENPSLSAMTHTGDHFADILVVVDTGIKSNQTAAHSGDPDSDTSYYLPTSAVLFKPLVFVSYHQLPPRTLPFFQRQLAYIHGSRAPPAQ
jgi:hypothetical protein